MLKATDKTITNRRSFLSLIAAAIPAAAVATGSVPTLAAAAKTDPIFEAIDAHRSAAAAYHAAESEYEEAQSQAENAAKAITQSSTAGEHWWHFFPNDLGFYGDFAIRYEPDPKFKGAMRLIPDGRRRVLDRPPAAGDTKGYSGISTHEHIDEMEDCGFMFQGECERLHAALDGNLRHKDFIDRLGLACDESIDLAQDAARNLVSTTPTTWPGTLAMLDYLPNMELLDGHLKIASASIGAALRSLAPA